MHSKSVKVGTGLLAYSDTLGTKEKCHFKQVSLYSLIFSVIKSCILGPKTVTVSEQTYLSGMVKRRNKVCFPMTQWCQEELTTESEGWTAKYQKQKE